MLSPLHKNSILGLLIGLAFWQAQLSPAQSVSPAMPTTRPADASQGGSVNDVPVPVPIKVAQPTVSAPSGRDAARKLFQTATDQLKRDADIGKAREWYLAALAIDPSFNAPRFNLGVLAESEGSIEQARVWYAEFCAIEGDTPAAAVARARLAALQINPIKKPSEPGPPQKGAKIVVPDQYRTIAEAFHAAKEGDTVQVHEGVYDVGQSAIQFKAGVNLEGAGRGKAVVRVGEPQSGKNPTNALIVKDCKSGRISGITFEQVKGRPKKPEVTAPVVGIVNSDIELFDCEILNGWDMGIIVVAGAPRIHDCLISANTGPGLEIDQGSKAVLDRVTCAGNGGQGISIELQSTPTVMNCICDGNHDAGIAVLGARTQASISHSACTKNDGAGIFFGDKASGKCELNLLDGNHHGIAIEGAETNPQLLKNKCVGNTLDGIHFGKGSSGECAQNILQQNMRSAIGKWIDSTANIHDNITGPNGEQTVTDLK